MDYRQLGKTGLAVSTLGFGCGAVGGLLVRGDRGDMVQVVAHAIEHGITYFDTAAIYGDGQSETNLGSVLDELNADVIIGTKVRLLAEDLTGDIEQAVINSVENSLKRLNRDYVDVIQLHNSVSTERDLDRRWVTPDDVEATIQAFQKLHAQGKVGHWGINGLGDTEAIHTALDGNAHTVQACYNLLNPTAGMPTPDGYPFQDFEQSINKATDKNMGIIAIRVLAAGALSGSISRHANAAQNVGPIATSNDFASDVERARRFDFLIEDGYVSSLVEAAIRFVISNSKISTTLVGISNLEQLEQAIEFTNKGSLPSEALEKLPDIWATM